MSTIAIRVFGQPHAAFLAGGPLSPLLAPIDKKFGLQLPPAALDHCTRS